MKKGPSGRVDRELGREEMSVIPRVLVKEGLTEKVARGQVDAYLGEEHAKRSAQKTQGLLEMHLG